MPNEADFIASIMCKATGAACSASMMPGLLLLLHMFQKSLRFHGGTVVNKRTASPGTALSSTVPTARGAASIASMHSPHRQHKETRKTATHTACSPASKPLSAVPTARGAAFIASMMRAVSLLLCNGFDCHRQDKDRHLHCLTHHRTIFSSANSKRCSFHG